MRKLSVFLSFFLLRLFLAFSGVTSPGCLRDFCRLRCPSPRRSSLGSFSSFFLGTRNETGREEVSLQETRRLSAEAARLLVRRRRPLPPALCSAAAFLEAVQQRVEDLSRRLQGVLSPAGEREAQRKEAEETEKKEKAEEEEEDEKEKKRTQKNPSSSLDDLVLILGNSSADLVGLLVFFLCFLSFYDYHRGPFLLQSLSLPEDASFVLDTAPCSVDTTSLSGLCSSPTALLLSLSPCSALLGHTHVCLSVGLCMCRL